jgi:SNF2 family DNA or RNA helicase
LPNSPLDAYGLYRFLDPSIFGTRYDEFESHYAVMGGFNNYQVLRYINLRELQDKMHSISLYVSSEQAKVQLPEETHYTCYAELDSEARATYRNLDKEFVIELNGKDIVMDNILAKQMKLQQITSGQTNTRLEDTGYYWSHKINLLRSILENMPTTMDLETGWINKEPIIVFARFAIDIERIVSLCTELGYKAGQLSGRKNQLQEWHDGKLNCLAVQMQAGSEGIDLTRAHYAIYYSKERGLGFYNQSLARIRRPNQKNAVTYIHLVIRDTIDEDIEKANAKKMDIIDYLLLKYKKGDK